MPFSIEHAMRASKARVLEHDTPRLAGAAAELSRVLRELRTDVLCTHGYKADLIGLVAATRLGIPIVAISHGWTYESRRVRFYEAIDRFFLRRMDRVVCVSEAQAGKVRLAGVPSERVVVIRNAIRPERFESLNAEYAGHLHSWFDGPFGRLVGAAGRLSPEKGFAVLVEAAEIVAQSDPSVRFVLFGEGRLRPDLERRLGASQLEKAFVLAGFRGDIDQFLPHLDLLVLPSYTEGLPNVILEAFAAGVPVVATAVGGTPEIVEDGVNGRLVPPGDPHSLAQSILEVLGDEERRRTMGLRGRERISREFSFASQGDSYLRLFQDLVGRNATTQNTASPAV